MLSNLLREGDAHSWTEEFQLAFEESKRLFDDKCLDYDDLQETWSLFWLESMESRRLFDA